MAQNDSPGDLEQRVSALEVEVAQLREQSVLTQTDAEAARVLASGADRDVSEVRAELRAHLGAINALRETQVEQGRRVDAGFAEMRTEMRAGFTHIAALLGSIEGEQS